MTSLYDFAKKVGQGGGTVNTTGLPPGEKQIIDKAVNDGKSGK